MISRLVCIALDILLVFLPKIGSKAKPFRSKYGNISYIKWQQERYLLKLAEACQLYFGNNNPEICAINHYLDSMEFAIKKELKRLSFEDPRAGSFMKIDTQRVYFRRNQIMTNAKQSA
jgi:hypothetical protein